MNSKLNQTPSRAQQWLGIILSLVATAVCGAAALLLGITPEPGGIPAFAVTLFAVLFGASLYLLYRFVSTTPQGMGPGAAKTVALLLSLTGLVCLLLSFLPGVPASKRFMLMAMGLSGLAYGPMAYAKRRR